LFVALAEGGQVTMPMDVMFWGDYFGSCTDRFGIRWMINCSAS
jgi:PhnB protein